MQKFQKIVFAFLAGLSLAACVTNANQTQLPSLCDENCLLQLAGAYMDALPANFPEDAPLAPDVRMTENGEDVSVGEGIWATAIGWSYRHTFVDPETGGVGIFGVVREESGKDAILAIRLKADNGLFSESEALVIHEGDFPLFETDATRARDAFYQLVPEERRNTREELAQIAEGYFNGLATGDPSALNFHPDCNRQENGYRTTNNPPRINFSCRDLYLFTYMHAYRTPDFPVIDTSRGLVLGVTAFDMPEAERTVMIRGKSFEINNERQKLPRTLFLYELFKVDNGQIMMIDAVLMNFPYGTKMGWGER